MEHGPGGIGSTHELSSEYGDPCFAKVVDGFDVVKSMFAETTIHDDEDTKYYFEEPIQVVSAVILGWNQQLAAEAAAIATNATIQHATGANANVNATANANVNATIQAATASAALSNLTDAATKIAASLAEVGESHKSADVLNHDPWNARKDSQNREKQDTEQGEEESGLEVVPSQTTADAGSKKDDLSDAKLEIPDDGLPRPGSGSSIDAAALDKEPSKESPELVDEGGNIDPRYADFDRQYHEKAADVKPEQSARADKKKKKELMMARS